MSIIDHTLIKYMPFHTYLNSLPLNHVYFGLENGSYVLENIISLAVETMLYTRLSIHIIVLYILLIYLRHNAISVCAMLSAHFPSWYENMAPLKHNESLLIQCCLSGYIIKTRMLESCLWTRYGLMAQKSFTYDTDVGHNTFWENGNTVFTTSHVTCKNHTWL